MLSEQFSSEAINQNIKPVADFYKMHGDETPAFYSNLIMNAMEAITKNEFDNPSRTPDEMEDIMFELRELNQLVLSLKNPVQWNESLQVN